MEPAIAADKGLVGYGIALTLSLTQPFTPNPPQVDYGFVEPSREGGDGCGTLTARGNACAAFADGHPLIV